MKTLFTTLCLVAGICVPGLGWNIPGHETVAAIGYLHLKANDPATITKVVALMKKHPEFATRWKTEYDAKTGDDKDMYLFMKAAGWPDVIKTDNPNHYKLNKPWHYINYPVVFDGAAVVQPGTTNNILAAIDNYVALLGSNESDANKAMALCWIFHLMGDLHQPLHNVALFGNTFPTEGDEGGNEFFVKTKKGNKSTMRLHSYWDGIVIKDKDFAKIKSKATTLKSSQGVSFDSNLNLNYQGWSKSFVQLAETSVYKYANKELKSGDEDSGKVIPSGYATNAKKVGEKQVATAGMRLAVVLKKSL